MPAARFFIDAPLASGATVDLPSTTAHHAARVLRLRDGAPIVLFNGEGGEFAATLSLQRSKASALIGAHTPIERESPLAITLLQSWISGDKLDWTVEKAVELGVASIVLAPAQRSVTQIGGDRAIRRIERLRGIAVAACEQCGRNRVPTIHAFASLAAALQSALSDGFGILLQPDADTPLTAVSAADHITLAVGPEGGFAQAETALAIGLGYRPHTLGPRILRTETAGLAALAVLQSIGGDLA